MIRAAAWIAVYLAIVAAPLVVLLFGDVPPGVEFWWDLAKALGFAVVSMMGIQFALTARFRALTSPFGIDIVYFLHRYLAIAGLVLALAHFAIFWVAYRDSLGTLNPLIAPWYMTSGRAALVLFALAVVTSEFREKLGLEYGLWRYLHIAFATLGLAAAIAHVLGVGYYTQAPIKRALWLSMTLSWIGLILWVRLIKPALSLRRPYAVKEVRYEGGEAWTLVLEPEGHSGLGGFEPGQFVWLTLRSSPFTPDEHPFSISSAPHDLPRVELTVRALGDFTERIGEVRSGERAYLEGPFGIFSHTRRPEADGFVFIVGGVGITPVISMLRSMAHGGEDRPLWLFYANPDLDRALFCEELERLAGRLDLTVVHILQNPPEDWSGESGYLSRQMIEREVPKSLRPRLHYFLCGPPPMLAASERHLEDLQVPRDHIHVEIFNL